MDKHSLKRWRKQAGGLGSAGKLSQAEAARLLGVDWSTIQRWESGKTEPVSWTMLALACAALLQGLPPYEGR